MPNTQSQKPESSNTNIVTVLLHDYFHRGVFKQVIGEKQWSRFESRLDKNVDDTLQLLSRYNVKATFFTLGWVADNYPDNVKKISAGGHEIANAGYYARGVRGMTPESFREDLRRSHRALEQAGANRIIGFRSAYQWFRKKDLWVLDILAEEGYQYDASYRPSFIGSSDNSLHRYAQKQNTKFGEIWEFPTSTHSVLGILFPISGGSYLRLFPYYFMFNYFKKWNKSTNHPFVLYFHPWELDTQQPEITAVGKFSKIRQYRNLGKMEWLLPNYFQEAKFQSVSDYLGVPLEYPDTPVSGLQPQTSNLMQGAFSPTPVAQCLKPEVVNPKPKAINLIPDAQCLTPITVVIPCYNESTSLPYLAKALQELEAQGKSRYRFKFLFVDDCSTDDTRSKISTIFGGNGNCKLISHEKNLGVAAALNTGVEMAETEIICTMDADCSYDPLELLKMLPLIDNDTDMVTASPYHKDGFVLSVPRWRLFLSKSLSNMYHVFLNHKLATYTSCFRVCRRNAIAAINTEYGDFRGIIELLARLDLQGGSIKEFPTTLNSRIFGYSKLKVLKTITGHLKLLCELIKLRLRPKHKKLL